MSTRAHVITAAIMAAVQNTFPALVLLGWVHVSADAQAQIVIAVGSYVTLGGLVVALFVKSAAAPVAPAALVTVPPLGITPGPVGTLDVPVQGGELPPGRIAAIDPASLPLAPPVPPVSPAVPQGGMP